MEKAFLLLSCEIGTENDLVTKLKTIPQITNVMITYGDYDIVAEAQTPNTEEMDALITSQIRKLEKIRSTITLRATD